MSGKCKYERGFKDILVAKSYKGIMKDLEIE